MDKKIENIKIVKRFFNLMIIVSVLYGCSEDDSELAADPRISTFSDGINFGTIFNGDTAVNSITITGRDLSSDMTISVTGSTYAVSENDSAVYVSELIIPASSLNPNGISETSINVRYIAPMLDESDSLGTLVENEGTLDIISQLGTESLPLSGAYSNQVAEIQWSDNFDFSNNTDANFLMCDRFPTFEEAMDENSADFGKWIHVRDGCAAMDFTDGLTFDGYPDAGVGNGLLIFSYPDRINYVRSLANVPTDSTADSTMYVSFMINVRTSRGEDGTNPISLGHWNDEVEPGTDFQTRFVVREENGEIKFGVSTNAARGEAVMASSAITPEQTYVVVMKYEVKAGEANDQTSLFILEEVVSDEPGSADVISISNGDRSVTNITLQSDERHENNDMTIDGIRIASTWEDVLDQLF